MRKIKDDYSIWKFILLGFITCGIYNLWVIYQLADDVNELCREDGKQTSGLLAYFLLSIVTCGLYGIFWWYRIADMLQSSARRRGVPTNISAGNVLICFLLNYVVGFTSYIGIYWVFEAVNALAKDHNNPREIPRVEL